MNNAILYSSIVSLFLVAACEKEPIIRFGFDTDFGKSSQGLTIMNIDSSTKSLTLTGEVAVTEGEVLVELVDPTGEIVFTGHIISPVIVNVNESYQAVPGNWKLRYSSIEGEGALTLHLKIVN